MNSNNFKSDLRRSKRLTLISPTYCDFRMKNLSSLTSMYFFENDCFDGWQYSDSCKNKLEKSIIMEKKLRMNVSEMNGRKPLYINIKKEEMKNEVINFNPNIAPTMELNLNCRNITGKMNPNFGKLKFFIHHGASLRMSKSLNTLIWIEYSTGIYSTFSQLIKENPSVFGESFEDSIFEIDTQIHTEDSVEFWLEELKKSYELARE